MLRGRAVQQCNAVGSFVDPATQAVPYLNAGAGGGIRLLFVNQQLLESLGLESGTAAAGTAEEQSSNTPGEVYPNLPDKYVSWEEAKAAGEKDAD